jgi:ABC-2 type transport system permease protein
MPMHALSVYFSLVRASIKSQMRYKLSMFFNVFGYFAIFWSEFIAIWILFAHFGSLAGWEMNEVLICYGLAHLSYSTAEFFTRGFEFLAPLTRMGDYDRYLLRPVDTAVQLAGYEFAIHRFGRILQALIVFVYGLVSLGSRATPTGLLLLFWAFLGGGALFCGTYVLQGAVGMKTLQNIEAFNILTNGGPEMAQFPMSIYPRPLRLLFTFLVPLAGVVYYPAITFLHKPAEAPLFLGWITPLGGFAFLLLSLFAFKVVEKSYISTGS